MRFLLVIAFMLLTATPTLAATAEQSLAGSSQECGTYTFHEDLIKGRTDGMVVHVHHTVGCFTYDFTNLIGTGRGESYGYSGQEKTCVEDGVQQTVGHFRYYRGVEIDPASVRVFCSKYVGPD